MSFPRTLLAFVMIALIWVQTAAAWHDAEHQLHAHDDTDVVCELFAGTADQPVAEPETIVTGTLSETAHQGATVCREKIDRRLILHWCRGPPASL